MRGLSLVAASGGHSSSWCAGLSLSRPFPLWSTGSRRAGSAVVAHGPSCSAACGILPDQGSNPCRLHWQADSQPLRHQGSPDIFKHEDIHYFWKIFIYYFIKKRDSALFSLIFPIWASNYFYMAMLLMLFALFLIIFFFMFKFTNCVYHYFCWNLLLS